MNIDAASFSENWITVERQIVIGQEEMSIQTTFIHVVS